MLDDFSRYIISWMLCTSIAARDVTDTLEMALAASGCDQARVQRRPRLLSDNGPSYVAGDLAEWLAGRGMDHVRGAPCHPQTQGKIDGTKRSRTASCWKTTICLATSKPRSKRSSSTTTTEIPREPAKPDAR